MFRILGATVRLVVIGALLLAAMSLTVGTGVPALDAGVEEAADDARDVVVEADVPVVSDAVGPAPGPPPDAGSHSEYEAAIASQVHDRINEVRSERGRRDLAYGEGLERIARYHSEDMAARTYFAHSGPDGERLTDRYDRFDYDCRASIDTFRYATGGENIYKSVAGSRRPPAEIAHEAVQGWLNSTAHRENLLKEYWDREGIGVAVERRGSATVVYVTQNFC